MSSDSVMLSNYLILCLIFFFYFQSFPASIFSKELALCIMWSKYWSFSFSINPPSEYSGLISFRIDWLDLLSVQETLKSLLPHHNSKVSIPRCSAFFVSNSYIHTWLLEKPWLWLFGRWWAKWCPCFLICCLRLVVAFLPRSKRL